MENRFLMSVRRISGYRTFCVFFNANEASVYRALLAFIFVAKILAGFPLFKQRGINYPPTFVGPPFLSRKEQFDVLICTCS